MNPKPSHDFPSERRIHIGLAVAQLDRAVDFYRALFEREPTKRRPGYAKFELADPAVNLSLAETPDAMRDPASSGLPTHYGIQVKSQAAVADVARRLAAAGLQPRLQEQVGCCYAMQDKAWVSDPDGHAWEVFVVTDDGHDQMRPEPEGGCCAVPEGGPSCCG